MGAGFSRKGRGSRSGIHSNVKKKPVSSRNPKRDVQPLVPTYSKQVGGGVIGVCWGNLTELVVDAIIVPSNSVAVVNNILQKAGSSTSQEYENGKASTPQNSIRTNGGELPCKRIYFIPSDKIRNEVDKWAFRNFVAESMKTAINDPENTVQTMAFPAIGCGRLGCDVKSAAEILISAIAFELERHHLLKISVFFVIQHSRQSILDAFQTALLTNDFSPKKEKRRVPPGSAVHARRKPVASDSDSFEIKKIPLVSSSTDYATVMQHFQSTMTSKEYTQIIRIEHIWNKRWYTQYLIHRRAFQQRLRKNTEKLLFHGCSETAANSIINEYFNRSFAGIHGTTYGKGVYFSSRANYSHTYTTPNAKGERCMFLALVLVGRTTRGDSSMTTCPKGFDSTTDGSHIFVTYFDAQAFGKYLITYK